MSHSVLRLCFGPGTLLGPCAQEDPAAKGTPKASAKKAAPTKGGASWVGGRSPRLVLSYISLVQGLLVRLSAVSRGFQSQIRYCCLV